MGYNTRPDNTIVDEKYNLTKKQSEFCVYYVELGNATQAAIKAGYSKNTAKAQGSRLLTLRGVKDKIYDMRHDAAKLKIATAQEVMDFFTKVMNGEVKDQFGLEASLSDRLKAANELAKRTVDVEQATSKSQKDNQIHIKLDWGTQDEEDEDRTKAEEQV